MSWAYTNIHDKFWQTYIPLKSFHVTSWWIYASPQKYPHMVCPVSPALWTQPAGDTWSTSIELGCFCSKLQVTHIYTVCPRELVSSTQNNDFCNIYLFLFDVVWGVLPLCVSVSRKVERWMVRLENAASCCRGEASPRSSDLPVCPCMESEKTREKAVCFLVLLCLEGMRSPSIP